MFRALILPQHEVSSNVFWKVVFSICLFIFAPCEVMPPSTSIWFRGDKSEENLSQTERVSSSFWVLRLWWSFTNSLSVIPDNQLGCKVYKCGYRQLLFGCSLQHLLNYDSSHQVLLVVRRYALSGRSLGSLTLRRPNCQPNKMMWCQLSPEFLSLIACGSFYESLQWLFWTCGGSAENCVKLHMLQRQYPRPRLIFQVWACVWLLSGKFER